MASQMLGCAEGNKKDYSTANFSVIKIPDGVYACVHKTGGKDILKVT